LSSSSAISPVESGLADVVIRPATIRDIDALQRFQQGIVSAERAFDSTLKATGVSYYDIEQMLSSTQLLFLVAECGGVVVGCGFARIDVAKPYLRHTHHGYLGLMYVEPAVRGQSINGKIVESLKQWCREQGVTELRLQVYSGNQAAIKAYEKTGFRPHLVEMRLDLGER
jgi:GNAT superfamily N-acetyltransferase